MNSQALGRGDRLKLNGTAMPQFANMSAFAEYQLVNENACVHVPDAVPMEVACLVGCSVMTGVGAVTNTARIPVGSTVAVIGAGGVGLNVIQGSRLAGAAEIIAIDTVAAKLTLARALGATQAIDATAEDNVVKAIRRMTGGGVDYAFECVGRGEVAAQAFGSLRKGGTAVVVGVAAQRDLTSVRTASLTLEEKTLTGSYFGSARPREDVPRLLALYREGLLKLDELVTRTYPLEEVNQAFAALAAGQVARSVLAIA